MKNSITNVPLSGNPKKRSTGIGGLNHLLDGGFSPGNLIMVYGSPLVGLEIMTRQFWTVEREEGKYLMNEGILEPGMVDASEFHPEMYLPQMIGSRIVVDSLSSMVIRYGIEGTLKFLHLAREEIQKRGGNLMFVVYTNIHAPVEMMQLMRMADVVIELRAEIRQNEIERTMVVHKIKDSAVPQRQLPYIITNNGIEASTTSRVV